MDPAVDDIVGVVVAVVVVVVVVVEAPKDPRCVVVAFEPGAMSLPL